MSRYEQTSCPSCDSSDAFTIYEDTGWGNCYSCNTRVPPEKVEDYMNGNKTDHRHTVTVSSVPNRDGLAEVSSYRSYPISSRNISQEVVDHFDVKMSTNQDGKPEAHYYPYHKQGEVAAYKVRTLPKAFKVIGDSKGTELFGQSVAGGGRTLVVTEGELDCMAVAQAYRDKYGRHYPVVSIPSASGLKVLLEQRDWVRGFNEVVLMFDSDEAGRKAVDEAAKIIGQGRAKVATLREKDPCDELIKYGSKALLEAVWNARTWSPAGILVGDAIWEKFVERQSVESVPYPACLEGLNQKLGGMRHGEITLFTSGTGSGKSTVIKEIILDLLSKTEDKVGLISLEESIGDTAEKFISMQLKRPLLDPPPVSEEDKRAAFDAVFGDERLVLLDHQGSVSDASLLDKIEYMALMGCKYLVLDHITIAVSEGADGLSGNEAIDKCMSDLLKIVKQHNVWLGLISHLRKTSGGKPFEEGQLAGLDDIKGSGSIKQISFDIIAFARNLVAENELEKNTIKLRVLKSRFTGRTGDAGAATYDTKTTRLQATGDIDMFDMI